MFGIVDGVLLGALPYRDPHQIVVMSEQLSGWTTKLGVSPPDFEVIRGSAASYSAVAAYRTVGYELSGTAEPIRLVGARVTPNLFPLLGSEAALGRTITEEDGKQRARVVVLSHGVWSRAFGPMPPSFSERPLKWKTGGGGCGSSNSIRSRSSSHLSPASAAGLLPPFGATVIRFTPSRAAASIVAEAPSENETAAANTPLQPMKASRKP